MSITHLGGRKFIITLLFWASATGLCAADKIGGGEFVTLAGLLLALFGSSNVAEHVVNRRAKE